MVMKCQDKHIYSMWKNYKKKYILLGRAAKNLRKGKKIFEFKDEQKFIKQGMTYMLEKTTQVNVQRDKRCLAHSGNGVHSN